ncbi:type II CRISPR RNA-guided endonuclease Cas9 [Inquilinus sp. CA228]|uniref:type II CRISPR RNA-guided endonuclease Cas9 n=1 Tax=Inquilinus sp. CA228 TaxID=3455609 RepID=UPI003F8D79E1
MTLIFGLDIGTTSIGFAVVEEHGNGASRFLRTGVRIFPEGVTEKEREPRNKERRAKRLLRRQIRRRRWRRRDLGHLLNEAGLLPAFDPSPGSAWQRMIAADPYNLRAKGLDAALTPMEVGRALYHLVKRRGFKSSRLEETARNGGTEDKETSKVKQAIAALDGRMGGTTLGVYLSNQEKKRGGYVGRDMVEDEFDRLWAAQAPHHPGIVTEGLREAVRVTAFHQRPTFWRLSTLGRCRLVPDSPLCARGSWAGQRYVLLQTLNSLRLVGGNEQPLESVERAKVLDLLDRQATVSFSTLRKVLGLRRDQSFNFEIGGRDKLKGNVFEATLRHAFGIDWDSHPACDMIRCDLHDRWFEIWYRRVGDRIEIRREDEVAPAKVAFIAAAQRDWGIAEHQAEALSDLSFPSAWLSISRAAVDRLLPALEAGERYDQAVASVFGVSHSQAEETGEIRDALPSRQSAMPDVRNPTVNRALTELRKVVNNLIRAHGRPAVIRIELARDLRLPKRKREELDKRNRDQERERKKAEAALRENGIEPTRTAIEAWLLWRECKETCPYTGAKICFDDLFRLGRFQVEHIAPRSRSLDNGFANKTLCDAQTNILKRNRTPFEFYTGRPDDWATVTARVKAVLPLHKVRAFLREDRPETSEELAERQLRDTGYISVAARDFLKLLGRDVTIESCNGRVTAQLRHAWGLDNILGDTGEKNRADHRHHAVDAAAVALATAARVKRLSDHYARDRQGEKPELAPPWPSIRADLKASVDQIVVSHRVWRKVSGALHAQTAMGDTGRDEVTKGVHYRWYVTRKRIEDLKLSDLEEDSDRRVVDSTIRRIVRDHVVERGGDLKKAIPPYPRLPTPDGIGREIRKIRVEIKQQPALMAPLDQSIHAFADTAANHHMAVFRMPDGRVRHEIVSLFNAARRLSAGEPVVRRQSPDGGAFVMSLCPGDALEFPRGDGGHDYRIVTSVWAAGPIVLCDHSAADRSVWKRPTAASVLAAGARKVRISPIGEILPAND